MKIVVLSDNRSNREDCRSEHGLSIYLECEHGRFLLDVGASDLFIDNAKHLGVDLSHVDYLFLSHGHSDHIGGLNAFLQINHHAQIIASEHLWESQYYSLRNSVHRISVDFDFSIIRDRWIKVTDHYIIGDHCWVMTNQSDHFSRPQGNCHLFRCNEEQSLVLDDFHHELIFAAKHKESLIIYTGCAHHGLQNIITTVANTLSLPIGWVIGGFHLLQTMPGVIGESDSSIRNIANWIQSNYPYTQLMTGHCTSDESFHLFREILKEQISLFGVGANYSF